TYLRPRSIIGSSGLSFPVASTPVRTTPVMPGLRSLSQLPSADWLVRRKPMALSTVRSQTRGSTFVGGWSAVAAASVQTNPANAATTAKVRRLPMGCFSLECGTISHSREDEAPAESATPLAHG